MAKRTKDTRADRQADADEARRHSDPNKSETTGEAADDSGATSSAESNDAAAIDAPLHADTFVDTSSKLTYQPHEGDLTDEQVAANQAVIDAARLHGRRLEESIHVGRREFRRITEYVPEKDFTGDIGDMRVFLRTGLEEIGEDGSITRSIKYYDGVNQLGLVQSVIENGVETFTNVQSYVPGAIDIKVGATRLVPAQVMTAAGVAPTTADPKSDGTYGSASQADRPDLGIANRDPFDQERAPPDTGTGPVASPDTPMTA